MEFPELSLALRAERLSPPSGKVRMVLDTTPPLTTVPAPAWIWDTIRELRCDLDITGAEEKS
jgi:hypothetical protein